MIAYQTQAVKPSRIHMTEHAGRFCYCSLVHKDDYTGDWGDVPEAPRRRSQLSSFYLFPKWNNHVFEFSLCMPRLQNAITIMDLHSQDGTKSPFYIVAHNDKFIFEFNNSGKVQRPIVVDEWVDFRIETNLYSFFRLYVDGEKLIDDEPVLRPDTVNFKIGCYEYYNAWDDPIRKIYFQI